MSNVDKPAFPISEETTDRICEGITIYTGLTKREYAAIHIAQGLIASQSQVAGYYTAKSILAEDAVNVADALLARLEE